MHCINEFGYILIISISSFLIFIHFTTQKTLKPSLAQRLKLIFKTYVPTMPMHNLIEYSNNYLKHQEVYGNTIDINHFRC